MYETIEHWNEWIKQTEEEVKVLTETQKEIDKLFPKENKNNSKNK
tara:strand:+ start:550 stop:684 length:135 start_codon:yes stop_codon:yes gene_type:complete